MTGNAHDGLFANALGTAANIGKCGFALAKRGVHAATGNKDGIVPAIANAGKEALGTRAGGAAQMVAGGAIAAAGVPMLILPGPGVLAIAGGAAIAAKGAQTAFGKRSPEKGEEEPGSNAETPCRNARYTAVPNENAGQ